MKMRDDMTNKKISKDSDDKENIFSTLGWVAGAIAIIILVPIIKESGNTGRPTHYATDTKYQKYTGVSNGDTLSVKMDDKLTGSSHQYKIDNLSDSANQLKNSIYVSSANKNYAKQNSTLVSTASKAYGFIISNDYKAVKFCSQYYPINNLKRKYDARFKDKKMKAAKILNNAFGDSGAKNLENTMMSNASVVYTFQKQMEDDYLAVKRMAAQDGIPNFTKKQYCKMLDESADDVVREEYNKFQIMVPNF